MFPRTFHNYGSVAATLLFAACASPVSASTIYTQATIDSAVAEALLDYKNDLENAEMPQAKAINYMALVVHRDPTTTATNGTLVSTRLLAQIRSLITGGHEPNANGSLSGWTHNSIAQAFVLAKNTPAVWTQLNTTEQAKITFLMQAMAIAANFEFSDNNNYFDDLFHEGNFNKLSNPNYREGYVGVAIAADLFFGATALNNIFTSFNYNSYISQASSYGFTNLLSCWQSFAWGPILENGGSDPSPGGGSGTGVRHPFVYQGIGLDNPFGIFKKLADYMYGGTVTGYPWTESPNVIDGLTIDGVVYSSTLNGGTSPYLGQAGICYEFHAIQGSGTDITPRSAINYAAEGWNNSVSTRATLEELGYWAGPAADIRDVQARMSVGANDLIFKAISGFSGYNSGMHQPDEYEADLQPRGYPYNKDIWLQDLQSMAGGYKTSDVGTVGAVGSASYSAGVYTVTGSGADIWGSADAFRYVYQPVTGDCSITARVTGVQDTDPSHNSKGGVMIRETLGAGSKEANANFRNVFGVDLLSRVTTGGVSTSTGQFATTAPYWVRMTRAGSVFTGSRSPDGVTWTAMGTATITMASDAYIGLAVCSKDDGLLCTSTFDHVSVVQLPSPWQTADIGAVGASGSAIDPNGTFSVTGSGTDIWNTADEFRYVYQSASGDCSITARVTAVEYSDATAKAGVMIRETLNANSRHVMAVFRHDSGAELIQRSATGGSSSSAGSFAAPVPFWLRVTRAGNVFTAYRSPDGSTWTSMGTATISMSASTFIGLAVCSHNDGVLCTSTFDNVTAVP